MLDGARNRIAAQNRQISSLEKEMAIYYGWNSRPSENPEHHKAIMEHREELRQYELDVEQAVAAGAPAGDEADSDNADPERHDGSIGAGKMRMRMAPYLKRPVGSRDARVLREKISQRRQYEYLQVCVKSAVPCLGSLSRLYGL